MRFTVSNCFLAHKMQWTGMVTKRKLNNCGVEENVGGCTVADVSRSMNETRGKKH